MHWLHTHNSLFDYKIPELETPVQLEHKKTMKNLSQCLLNEWPSTMFNRRWFEMKMPTFAYHNDNKYFHFTSHKHTVCVCVCACYGMRPICCLWFRNVQFHWDSTGPYLDANWLSSSCNMATVSLFLIWFCKWNASLWKCLFHTRLIFVLKFKYLKCRPTQRKCER